MRLLKCNKSGLISLTDDLADDEIPPYAILSHTWGKPDEEVSLEDFSKNAGDSKAGYEKARFCGEQAVRDGLGYFWMDTCCIDQSSSTEVSTAVNSMFRWYHNAERCYVYLSDVCGTALDTDDATCQQLWEAEFRESIWFTRGWTLQELIAPKLVEFFSRDGKKLGDKKSLERQICEITGVPVSALRGFPLSEFEIHERFSWAAKRKTKRAEDVVYSLFGIFGVHLPVIYGEGLEHATIRLKEEIHKRYSRSKLEHSMKGNLAAALGPYQETIRIVVFGMTGTGKTSLIKLLAGEAAKDLKTGHGLESCTEGIAEVQCNIGGRRVILVDTPGFDDSTRSDTEILTLIAAWLQDSFKEHTFLSGIIYLHRISDIRMSGSSIKNLRMFRKLCGRDNLSGVRLVTTMWDTVTLEKGEAREKELCKPDGRWSSMIASGSTVRRHDGSLQSAQTLVREMLDNTAIIVKLQQEIADGKALIETDAGAFINEQISIIQNTHQEEIEALKEETALAVRQGNMELQKQLEADYAKRVAEMKQSAEDQNQLQRTRARQLEAQLREQRERASEIKMELQKHQEKISTLEADRNPEKSLYRVILTRRPRYG